MDPTDLSGLQSWYDPDQEVFANGASVNPGTDWSGNGHSLTPSSGTVATLEYAAWNGKKLFNCLGSGNYFDVTSPITVTTGTLHFVALYSGVTTGILASNAATSSFVTMSRETTPQTIRYNTTTGGTLSGSFSSICKSDRLALYTIIVSASSVQILCNGEIMKEYGTVTGDTGTSLVLARLFPGFLGKVGDICVYNTIQTQAEVRSLFDGYFSTKYDITPKSVFVAQTNSLGEDVCRTMEGDLANDVECFTFLYPGQGMSKFQTEFNAVVLPFYTARRPHCFSVGYDVYNGLLGSSNQVAYLAEYVTYCDTGTAAGFLNIATTAAAAYKAGDAGSADWQSAWEFMRDSVRSGWPAYASALADPASVPECDSLSKCGNTTYYSDASGGLDNGVHHTDALRLLIGPEFTAAVQSVLDLDSVIVNITTLNATTLTVG